MTIRKTFQYRLYPTKAQEQTFLFILRRCRELYNAALQHRRDCWRFNRVNIFYTDQNVELPGIKEVRPEYKGIYSQILVDVLRRLDKAFTAFFRQVKNGETPGYPRFKSANRYHSFTYPQLGFSLNSNRPTLAKIGHIKVWLHRPIEGTIKTCTIKRDVDQWYVLFSYEVEAQPLPPSNEMVGIDLGVTYFATLSTGEHIENPRPYRKGLKRLKLLQQAKDRKKRLSHHRKHAVIALARTYRKVRNQRKDFHHKLAHRLVNEYGTLVFEKLEIANMTSAPEPKQDENGTYLPNGAAAKADLNQSILDAGWGQFQQFCVAKAAEAGRRVLFVPPAGTSQQCSNEKCLKLVPKDPDMRWHSCPHCGLELDRDHNAALNILRLRRSQQVDAC